MIKKTNKNNEKTRVNCVKMEQPMLKSPQKLKCSSLQQQMVLSLHTYPQSPTQTQSSGRDGKTWSHDGITVPGLPPNCSPHTAAWSGCLSAWRQAGDQTSTDDSHRENRGHPLVLMCKQATNDVDACEIPTEASTWETKVDKSENYRCVWGNETF